MAGAPVYLVHLSSVEALDVVVAARARGLPVFAETCPQYLVLSDACYEEPGFGGAKYVMSPPLRPAQGLARLWHGLAARELDVVSTDHCPFNLRGQKDLGRDDFSRIPNGAPGIETRLTLVYDRGVRAGHLPMTRLVDVMATTPARLFGLAPRKGAIAVGGDADLVVFDPQTNHTLSARSLHMRVDYSPYEGLEVTGAVRTVLCRGRLTVEDGRFVGRAGAGAFVARAPRI
jgi:dihydropyrimidinase